MQKRVVSLLIMMTVLLASVQVFAVEGLEVSITRDEMNGNSYSFELTYSIQNVKKGDVLTISTPFPVKIAGKDMFDVEQVGDSTYNLVAVDDFINVRGVVGGTKTLSKTETLNPIVVNGSVVKDTYPDIEHGVGQPSGERDRFYKHGEINDDIITWDVVIGGDKKGVPATKITDEIAGGHILIEDSVTFNVLEGEDYNDALVPMIVKNVETTPYTIDVEIDTISPNETLMMSYKTRITDMDQKEYANQIIIEGEKKITETVSIEDYSDVGGEKPTKPEEPELPQVGEHLVKKELVIGIMLIGVALLVAKGEN